MTIVYPIDLLADFPGWSTKFEPLFRQEQSRTAGGVTYIKDLGSPLWSAAYQTKQLKPNDLDGWRARIEVLEGGLQYFRGYSLSRSRPIAYPTGKPVPDNGVVLSAIGGDNKSVTISGLGAGYMVSVGDMIQIAGSGLYRVVEGAVANGAGAAGAFEVRPHLWPGTAVGSAVTLLRPSCTMMIVPGSISSEADASTGRGSVSFQGIEVR
ncbi:hypothetical protein [Agrobacterium vitis]|uniref:Uncharacterized protein n=1 Tax=Agrobacterium vitis TaxID=373 RepID=A0AAE2RGT7_AGRVI|nr:hypothetical protein [Agrobacterium vitis]MBF2716257.1 hypothetical protein [Agrobacterium vitis]MVA22558.1 hypothetical protein [Agrobacterium vitis]